MKMANGIKLHAPPLRLVSDAGMGGHAFDSVPPQSLTAGLVRFFSNCGVMKAAVDATVQAGK
jgi:hypothetical protein